jgi:hyperosmotically inducible protein
MKSQLLATMLIGSVAVISPAIAYSADRDADHSTSAKNVVKDSVITTKIKASMATDEQVSATNIKVETDDHGVVHLGGTAKSKAEADRAVQIAHNTEGVTSVKNNIHVGTK